MRSRRALAFASVVLLSCGGVEKRGARGVVLERVPWTEAAKALTQDAVVVVPIGAASKEHGPHLSLGNDFRMAEYLKERLVEREDVVVAPTVPYSYYPAFLDYPGSTSLRLETARDVIVDVCKSLARHGPRRFYALNTGVSTRHPLAAAAEELAKEHLLLRYTDILAALAPTGKRIARQEGGTHADELETSMMLVIDPASVDMSKAAHDYDAARDKPGAPLVRDAAQEGKYSPSGVWGDARLATREKGAALVAALLDAIARDVEALKGAPLP